MKKLMTVAGACLLAACNSGTVTGPDPVEQAPAPAPVVATTPAPQAVVPPPSAEHDASVKGGFYSVTNETSVPQFYCAAAFGVLPGGEQGAGTNLYEDQGIRQPKDVFSGQAPKTAACQYKQIQVDLTQSKDCRNFDWHNVLAAEVYDNPNYGKCPEPEPTPNPSPSPTPAPTCADLNPQPGAVTKSIAIVTTKHAGTPAQFFYYWDMDNGNGNIPKQNACEGRGGVWLGDEYNIPNDNSNNEYDDVCRTTFDGLAGQQGVDADFIKKVQTQAATPDKYSVTVTLSYSIAAGAAQTRTFKIVYGGDFVKKQVTVQVACGQAASGTLVWGQGDQYNNSPNYSAGDGHVTGTYSAVVQ